MNYCVILAGGNGSRLNEKIAKQHIVVLNHQIIEYTLMAFSSVEEVDKIIVVSNSDYINEVNSLKEKFPKLFKVIAGGETRIFSVYNSIKYLNEIADDNDNIILSDAARPCITKREIISLIRKLDNHLAVTTGINCYETILKIDGSKINQVLKRDGMIRQTSPEAYKFSILKWLYLNSNRDIIKNYSNIGIDQLFACGIEIGIVMSNPLNFKITTNEDLNLFENVVKQGFENFINKE